MRRAFLITLATLGLSFQALAQTPNSSGNLASEIRARLAQPEVLRGEFEQSKSVPGFAKPLVSRGDFLVSRERGVLWRTREPFASELRLTRKEIQSRQGGAVNFKLDADKEPAVKMINGLMFALLAGDVAQLGELFSLNGQVQAKSWQLKLAPKQAALASLLSRIELQGDSHVRRILIDEANGDQTQIRFSQQSSEPAQLSATERARFD